MTVLTILLIFLFITYIAFGQNCRKFYVISSFCALTVVAALRSYKVGPDGSVYANYFEMLENMDYSGISVYFTKEPVFYYLTKFLQNLGVTLQVWYGIIGGLFAVSICVIVYRYSEHEFLSLLSLLALGYYVFSFTGLRQTVALSLITLSIPFLERKKYATYIVFVLLAMLFHNSAIIFLIMLFVRNIKFTSKQYVSAIILGLIGVIAFKGPVYNLIYRIVESTGRFEGYSGYSYGLSWAGYIIQVAIFLFAIFCMDKNVVEKNRIFINLSFLGIFFQMFSALMAEMFRISMYFSLANIILISNVCMRNRFTEKSNRMAYFMVIAALIWYFIHSHINYQYYFCW